VYKLLTSVSICGTQLETASCSRLQKCRILTDSPHRPLRKLHGHAMQAAVLMHQGLAGNADNLAIGKTSSQTFQRNGVHRVAVNRRHDRAIDDQEVGIIGWELLSVFIMNRFRQRQRYQMIDVSILGSKRLELRFHEFQAVVVRVFGIVAAGVSDGVRRAKTGQGVDMGIGIVAAQVFLVQPEHPFCAQMLEQLLFYFLLAQAFVPVRI